VSRPVALIGRLGQTPSALATERLVSLTVTDEAGFESDSVSVAFDNRDQVITPPAKGEIITVQLGYDGESLFDMGRYTVDEVGSQGGRAQQLTVKAKAADVTKQLKEKRTKAWSGVTIGDVVSEIAARHALEPKVDAAFVGIELGAIPYRQVDQTNESDMHFLRRLALQHDAVTKPVDGQLIFGPAGAARQADGTPRPAFVLSEQDVSNWSALAPDRDRYAAATATYLDAATQERQTVTAGGGSPIFAIKTLYSDASAAQEAAQGKLNSLARGTQTLDISMPGHPAIMAETKVVFDTADVLAAGSWVVTRAVHTLRESLTTRLNLEAPK